MLNFKVRIIVDADFSTVMISEVGVRLFKLVMKGNRGGGDRKSRRGCC